LYSTVAILAALAHRQHDGGGQHIDMALLDVQVACLANQAMNYLTTGVSPKRLGNAHPNIVPYQDFPTADGDFILTVGMTVSSASLRRWRGSEWADDPGLLLIPLRVANRSVLVPLIRQATVFKTTAEWVSQLERSVCPAGRSMIWRRCLPILRCRRVTWR
jgi:crotonobetainyl-CoA:carnitine CoA-transferase CaiB-like acyl-CoA transferase